MKAYKREMLVGAGVGLFIIVGIFGWQYFSSAPAQPVPKVESGRYVNTGYRFSFVLPQGFGVRELEGVVVVANDEGDGVQVVITPIDKDISALTEERVLAELPDLEVRESHEVEIEEGRTGLAFASTNEAFDGFSREVWFVYPEPSGEAVYLYQLSTYERLAPLLQAIVDTWAFF